MYGARLGTGIGISIKPGTPASASAFCNKGLPPPAEALPG